jgi:uncharacterized SAM-binding protein YcdF (DUF218 family)
MYHVLVWDFVQPFTVLWFLTAVALAGLWWKRREGRPRLLAVTLPFAVLTLLSLPIVSHGVLWLLETRFPPCGDRPAEAEAIVVLASYVYPPDFPGGRPTLDDEALDRCRKAADIYLQGQRCPVLVSGGNAEPGAQRYNSAEVMSEFLVRLGVDSRDLVVENRSRTTYENAVESGKLLAARGIHRIALVTTAAHLPRAAACFRRQGFDVFPCGCHYRANDFRWSVGLFIPKAQFAENSDSAAHEWVGLLWYWMHGRI